MCTVGWASRRLPCYIFLIMHLESFVWVSEGVKRRSWSYLVCCYARESRYRAIFRSSTWTEMYTYFDLKVSANGAYSGRTNFRLGLSCLYDDWLFVVSACYPLGQALLDWLVTGVRRKKNDLVR